MKRVVVAKLPPAAGGMTLLDYLAGRFNYHTREVWSQKISEQRLKLNDEICCDPQRILQADEIMEYMPELLPEPPVNTAYEIIYEDDYLYVINKPGNLPVHPAGAYFNHTLWVLLQEADYGKVHFVNRLDRETSGVLIAAKSSRIAGELAADLENMRKVYRVIVHGKFPNELIADGALLKDEKSVIRKKQRYIALDETCSMLPGNAVKVKTRFELLQYKNDLSLLSAELFTGKMHQIRATLCSLDFPVVGDKLYGLNEQYYSRLAQDALTAEDHAALLLPRQALHCAEMSFKHPVTGEVMTFNAPMPQEMLNILA